MNTYLPLTITLLAIFLANATAKAGAAAPVASSTDSSIELVSDR